MRICLIKPPILHKGASFALMPTAPLGLAYIAGALKREGHEIQVVDATAEGIGQVELFRDKVFVFGLNKQEVARRIHPETDVICFSFMFTNNWLYDRELVSEIHGMFPNAVLIAGGEHITAATEFSMRQAPALEFCVLGEGEAAIVELIDAIWKNVGHNDIQGIGYRQGDRIVLSKRRTRIAEVENIAWPAWECFPVKSYFDHRMSHGVYRGKTLPVMASRGCPYECTFCSSPQMWGRKYQIRPPKDFVNELEYLYNTFGATNFDLYDLTAIIYRDWTILVCKEILDRGLDITFQLPSGTRAEAIDYEVAQHLFRAGCKNITYAPESGSKSILKSVKKKVKLDKMLESIRSSSRAGLNIHLNMIIGFPDERHWDIIQTLWFLVKCSWHGANDVAVAVFTPYPGSQLFDRLTKEKKLDLYDDDHIMGIIDSYDLWPSMVYSSNISSTAIKMYVFLLLASFYSTNYLFRPLRLLRTIRNIITHRHESRLEQILYKNFFSNTLKVIRPHGQQREKQRKGKVTHPT